MNRFVVAGLLDEMRCGKRVVVVSSTVALSSHVFAEIAAAVDPTEKTWRAKSGQKIMSANGVGAIHFRPIGSHAQRGVSADLVYIEDPDHRMTPDLWSDITLIAAAASPAGEIVRA